MFSIGRSLLFSHGYVPDSPVIEGGALQQPAAQRGRAAIRDTPKAGTERWAPEIDTSLHKTAPCRTV